MTNVYFVRHAEPNYSNHNDCERELSEKGLNDRKLVTAYLSTKNITVVLSSPYKRAVDTVKHFADSHNLPIEEISDFRERKVDSGWIPDFDTFSKRQWADFTYKLTDGEALGEVQKRNIDALFSVIDKYHDKNIAVGSHGTALSTIINYFDKSFTYQDFSRIKTRMPWIVKLSFDHAILKDIEYVDVFSQ